MNTPADKPDLPELPAYSLPGDHPPISHVVSLREAIEYAEACRADERRKARAELIAEMEEKPAGYLIDWPDEPELGHYYAEEPTDTGRCQPLTIIPTRE